MELGGAEKKFSDAVWVGRYDAYHPYALTGQPHANAHFALSFQPGDKVCLIYKNLSGYSLSRSGYSSL